MIVPTVGRIVWFYAGAEPFGEMAAIVTAVHGDRLINAMVFGPLGHADIAQHKSIQLWQEGDPEPIGKHCRWMPYQINQARKHEGGPA